MEIIDRLKGMPELQTKRLLLRKCGYKDIDAMYAVACNPNVTRYVMWAPHESVEATRAFIDSMVAGYAEGNCFAWAICDRETDAFMGMITLLNIREKHSRCELGYWLGEPHWGRGYMTEAVRAVIDYAFNQLGMHRVAAGHLSENAASGRVMQKAGMAYEGVSRHEAFKDGRFHDVVRYAIINERDAE